MPASERRIEASTATSAAIAQARNLLAQAVALLAQVDGGAGSPGSATVTNGTVTVKAAMARMSIGRTKLNELINDGVIAKIKCGRKTLLSLSDIDRYLNESVVSA